MRILFVDDDPDIVHALSRNKHYAEWSWEVRCVDSAEKALLELASGDFDVIVADSLMPGIDGETLLTFVRSGYPTIRRILMTGLLDQRQEVDNSAVEYRLAKPFQPSELREIVEKLRP